MSCNKFNSCVNNEKQNLGYPTDTKSLYNDRVYDNQTANNRCYNKNPINIVEGFGNKNMINCLIKWAIIILIVYVIVTVAMEIFQPNQIFKLDIQTPRATVGGNTFSFLDN